MSGYPTEGKEESLVGETSLNNILLNLCNSVFRMKHKAFFQLARKWLCMCSHVSDEYIFGSSCRHEL